jgi:hypothetical protein
MISVLNHHSHHLLKGHGSQTICNVGAMVYGPWGKENIMKLDFGRPTKPPRDYFTYRVEKIIVREADALSLIEDSMTHSDFVEHCVSGMPKPERPKRDLRRRDIERSLQNMCDRGRLPFGVAGDRFVF